MLSNLSRLIALEMASLNTSGDFDQYNGFLGRKLYPVNNNIAREPLVLIFVR